MYDRCYDGGQVKEIFKLGFELFIDAVKQNPVVRKIGGIRCPCAVCQCRRIHSEDDIKYHLERKGFQPNYLIWTSHGETFPSDQGASSSVGPMSLASQNYHGRYPFNAMNDMIGNALGFHEANEDEYEADEPPNAEAQRFYNFLKQTNEPLLIEELALDQIAKLVLDTTPISVRGDLPQTFYEAKQLVSKLGLGVKRIDCCINGCMLFYNNEFGVSDGDLVECKFCQEPRYRETRYSRSNRRKPVPRKSMFYLPIISRLQRMYASLQTATKMTWHSENYEKRKSSGEEAHEDQEIRDIDLLDPEKYLLVDRHKRAIIMPFANDYQPHKAGTSAITFILQSNYNESWLSWGEIKDKKIGDEPLRNRFWNAFKTKCTWLKEHDMQVDHIFDHKCTKRLSALLLEARKCFRNNKPPPKWIGEGDLSTELKEKWGSDAYNKKCNTAKKNRSVQLDASIHSGGSTSSSTLRIRFEQTYHRASTMKEMNQFLHLRPDGTWDSVRAERANTKIQAYIKEIKASEAALPPDKRKSIEVLHNMILDKFVEFSGGKHKGHVQGQGCTSSFIQRTPSGYVDVLMNSYNSSSSMSTGRSSRVDSLAEMEQRLRAENQQYLAIMRQEMRQEITQEIREELIGSQHIPFENLVNPRPPVQQNQAVGRNPQSSFYQPDQFHEDEYRPDMSYTDEPVDQTFFDNLQNHPILQTLIGDEDLEIPGFTNATHDGASGSGINNIQDVGTAFVNQSGGGGITPFNLTSFQGGPNEFNVSGRRTSARSASGGRTSSKGASGGRTRGRGGAS
ncbi:hypothetical protein TSUD_175400 [Trifolium subterraneum]|uniref:Transposase-associated domain-containing protein n=1 Tax=Trifolium subterraneum TaxID=3900 RepID=A0A2Z6NP44_TRISU|nr:hypothetical protein TSUD_175400 [Trifolium subterraneum]